VHSLYPDAPFTKPDAISFYRSIAPFILPHLRHRPMSFKRYVDDVRGESFWEKDAPAFTPSWMKRFAVPRREGAPIEYIVIDNAKTLLWVASVGGIELHPFLHRVPRINIATHVVFDLDPGAGADLADCARVALLLRDALGTIGLESCAKVSGSKGIQVYVPLNSDVPHAATEPFARVVAQELARAYPKLVVARMAKSLRAKKVFIDWSQNAGFKTTVAVYSLRAKRDVPLVSMPVRWEELERDPLRLEFSPTAALARVRKLGDLFAPVLTLKQSLRVTAPKSRVTTSRRVAEAAPTQLPKAKSQSGRRLFLLTKTETGDELWLDMNGAFTRWILRRDREGGERLVAMPAGEFPIDPAYRRGEVPARWKGRTTIEDAGAYEIIEGSFARERFELWFSGRVLSGAWTLEKAPGAEHKSWRLEPPRLKPARLKPARTSGAPSSAKSRRRRTGGR
jgi:bifunctional non-homologous end joining protein LigD